MDSTTSAPGTWGRAVASQVKPRGQRTVLPYLDEAERPLQDAVYSVCLAVIQARQSCVKRSATL